jgi:hypothetical protein
MDTYARYFMDKLEGYVQIVLGEVTPFRAIVTGVSSGRIQFRAVSATTGRTQRDARVYGMKIDVGDEVLVVPTGPRKYVVIGVLQRASSTTSDYEFDNRVTFNEAINVQNRILANNVPVQGGIIQGGRAVYLTNLYPLGALSNQTVVANRCYYVPVWVPEDFSCTGFQFEVTTALSGDVKCGLYDCTSSFLPGSSLLQSTKTTVTTTGLKFFSTTSTPVTGGRWYFVGIACTTAMGLKGSSTDANLPSLRGGVTASDGTTAVLIANETLSGGWTVLPATASAGSSTSIYLHVGMRA